MAVIPHTTWWETWAPVVARVLLGGLFLMGASMKIPGTASFAMESGMAASAGIPMATIAVALAFVLELAGGLALILGWHARIAACLLAIFTLALAFIFYGNFSDPMTMGQFMSHLGLVAGFLYISVYGAKSVALRRD